MCIPSFLILVFLPLTQEPVPRSLSENVLTFPLEQTSKNGDSMLFHHSLIESTMRIVYQNQMKLTTYGEDFLCISKWHELIRDEYESIHVLDCDLSLGKGIAEKKGFLTESMTCTPGKPTSVTRRKWQFHCRLRLNQKFSSTSLSNVGNRLWWTDEQQIELRTRASIALGLD